MTSKIKKMAIYCFFVFLGGAIPLTNPIYAEEIEISKKVLNFVLPYRFPYSWIGDKGEKKGIFVDFAQAFFKDSGFDINIQILNHSRFRRDVNLGNRDISISSQFISSGGSSIVLGPIFCSNIAVVPFNGNGIATVDGLKGKTISAVSGSVSSQKFDRDPAINVIYVANTLDNIKLLILERVDAIMTSSVTLEGIFKDPPSDFPLSNQDYEKFGKPFPVYPFNVNLTIDKKSVSTAELTILKNRMVDFQKSEDYKNILINYGNPEDLFCS